jgi:hypothetical protein
MKNFRLILITENQNSLEKGKKFAESICETLNCETLNCENGFEISKYEKIKNSYRVEIIGKIADPNNSVSESIQLTDRICSPWIVNFDRTQNEVRLHHGIRLKFIKTLFSLEHIYSYDLIANLYNF